MKGTCNSPFVTKKDLDSMILTPDAILSVLGDNAVNKAIHAIDADHSVNSDNSDHANTADTAESADKATKDSKGNTITFTANGIQSRLGNTPVARATGDSSGNNISTTYAKKSELVNEGVIDWSKAVSLAHDARSFTAPKPGYYIMCWDSFNEDAFEIYVNGKLVNRHKADDSSAPSEITIPVSTGDKITMTSNTRNMYGAYFVPLKEVG